MNFVRENELVREPAGTSASPILKVPAEPASSKKILLVEDDLAYAYLLRRIVESEALGEYRIEEVHYLSSALECSDLEDLGCILLDLHLPDSSGLETFREVNRKARDVPIVVLSGLDDQKVAVQAVREGAQDYLVKGSIDGPLILRAVRYAIERHQTQENLRLLSLEDDLTSLYNRRGFLTLGEQQIKIARRTGRPLIVLFLDLDGLKQINDTLGHEEGNRAILDTAALLSSSFRESDIVGRLGGDEFVVLLEGVSPESFRYLFQRFETQIEAINEEPGRRFELSISWGTAALDPQNPRPLEKLIQEADEAMYEMKRAKKNR